MAYGGQNLSSTDRAPLGLCAYVLKCQSHLQDITISVKPICGVASPVVQWVGIGLSMERI